MVCVLWYWLVCVLLLKIGRLIVGLILLMFDEFLIRLFSFSDCNLIRFDRLILG